MRNKPLSKLDAEDLADDVFEEKKALPDLVLKRYIFEAQNNMIVAHKVLLMNRNRNGGHTNPLDVTVLKSTLISLFSFVNEMAKENKYLYLDDIPHPIYNKRFTDYALMIKLIYFEDLDINTLIRLYLYNLNILHRLNLTNLFLDPPQTSYDIEKLA
jgi:hypothetical protein